MTDLYEATNNALDVAARAIRARPDGAEPITRRQMNAAMTSAFGGTDAQGRWTQRDNFQLL